MTRKVVPFRSPRQDAAVRLRSELCSSGLTQDDAGELAGVDGRQVRRWMSGRVSLGPLELLCALERFRADRAALAERGRAHPESSANSCACALACSARNSNEREAA